jgi:AcrR family transcriptional regulator
VEQALTEGKSSRRGVRTGRRRKPARAEELRDAALALFVEKGFDGTLTEEIAARAGVSKGTLYLYFPSKEALLRAAITSPALAALAHVRPVIKCDGNSSDALRRVLSDIREQLQDETVGSALKLALAEARRFPEILDFWLLDVVRPMRSSIAQVVLQGIDRGELRQLDPDLVAHSLFLPMLMSCLHRRVMDAGAPIDRCLNDGFIVQHVELVLQGLCRDPQATCQARIKEGP